ncbi:MAG: hypothetical protein IH594_03370 [Bacteroidales bacterium]|nr:hypothetical protein [Bacteroidales bacterium]
MLQILEAIVSHKDAGHDDPDDLANNHEGIVQGNVDFLHHFESNPDGTPLHKWGINTILVPGITTIHTEA